MNQGDRTSRSGDWRKLLANFISIGLSRTSADLRVGILESIFRSSGHFGDGVAFMHVDQQRRRMRG